MLGYHFLFEKIDQRKQFSVILFGQKARSLVDAVDTCNLNGRRGGDNLTESAAEQRQKIIEHFLVYKLVRLFVPENDFVFAGSGLEGVRNIDERIGKTYKQPYFGRVDTDETVICGLADGVYGNVGGNVYGCQAGSKQIVFDKPVFFCGFSNLSNVFGSVVLKFSVGRKNFNLRRKGNVPAIRGPGAGAEKNCER